MRTIFLINEIIYSRIIFNENGYTTEECLRFKPVIFSNTIQSMLAILHAMSRLQISFENVNRKVLKFYKLLIKTNSIFQKDAEVVLNHAQIAANHEIIPEMIGRAIQALWNDNGVQACFLRSREYQLNDSAAQ